MLFRSSTLLPNSSFDPLSTMSTVFPSLNTSVFVLGNSSNAISFCA